MLLTVVVPHGLRPGDTMDVEAAGQNFTVTVPDGCGAGMELQIDLPVEEEGGGGGDDSGTQQVELVVPDDVLPGMAFNVETDWGGVFEIVSPDGCAPGDAIVVELPARPPDESSPSKANASAAPATDENDAGNNYKFKPGQRVELLRSDGALSAGTVVCGFEGVLDVLYKVRMDNGLFKEAVPEEEISGECCEVGDLFDGL